MSPRKLAVFLPNWVGDAVMATAALRRIREDFPAVEIVGIARPVIAETLAGSGLVDRTLLYNPRGKNPAQRGSGFLRQLQAEQCETALLLTNSLRTAWLAWRSGARRRIGFARDWRNWLLTDAVTPRSRSVPNPVIDEYLRLVERLGCTLPAAAESRYAMSLAVDSTAAQVWQNFRQRHPPLQSRRQLIAFNSGGAFGPAKNWPRESFAELARRIVTETDSAVVILCGPAERDDARWIAQQAGSDFVVSLADEPLSIGLTQAAIHDCDLLVTTDSGPRHFAAAYDVPVVTLFGPTHIAWSETHYPRATHLQIAVDCGPCQQRECPQKHHRCMRDLTVEQVWQAVRSQIDAHGTASRRRAS